ncbi:MAG: FG-GAP-like repeat-containing protein [Actinomycetes bacterium]
MTVHQGIPGPLPALRAPSAARSHPRSERSRALRLIPVAMAGAALVTGLIVGGSTSAQASGPCAAVGQVQVPASAWLAAGGVDVVGNGQCDGDPASHTGALHQSQELAARLYQSKGWGDAALHLANDRAKDLWAILPTRGFEQQPNGNAHPVPGDLIIEDSGYDSGGHVAVVDSITGSTLVALEQNGSATGWHNYSIGPSITAGGMTIGLGYGPVIGILHAPANGVSPPARHRADVVYTQVLGGRTRYVAGVSNGDGSFRWSVIPGPTRPGAQLALGDVNADGRADVVFAEASGARRVFAGLSNGDGTFRWVRVTGFSGPMTALDLGDITGDGRADVVYTQVRGGRTRYVAGVSNGDGSFRWSVVPGPTRPGAQLALGDVNADGRADVVFAEASGARRVFAGVSNGDGTFRWVRVTGPSGPMTALDLGDITGD